MKKILCILLALLALPSLSLPSFSEDAPLNSAVETAIIVGNDTLGYINLASCGDVLGEAQIDNTYNFAAISSTDRYNLARITILYENCGNNSNFNAVTAYIRNQYNSKASDDDRYNYKILAEEQAEVGGLPAYKISAEKGDLYGFCDTYSYVSYVFGNTANGFVHVQLVAPKDGWKDDYGNAFRPSIADLCCIVENTYSKTRP